MLPFRLNKGVNAKAMLSDFEEQWNSKEKTNDRCCYIGKLDWYDENFSLRRAN